MFDVTPLIILATSLRRFSLMMMLDDAEKRAAQAVTRHALLLEFYACFDVFI